MSARKMSSARVCCCCGKSAPAATRIISIIDMVVFSTFFLIVVLTTACYIIAPDSLGTVLHPLRKDLASFMRLNSVIRMYILMSLLVWSLAEIGFATILFFGTRKRSYAMLRAWIFLIIVDCLFAMVAFIQLVVSTSHFFFFLIMSIVYYGYRVLSLWTVHLLLRDVVSRIEWV